MSARLKDIIGLLLLGSFAYAIYTMLPNRPAVSDFERFEHDTLASYVRQLDAKPPMGQRRWNAVSLNVNDAAIDVRSDRCRRKRYIDLERLTASVVVNLPGTGVDVEQFQWAVDSLLSGAQALVDEVLVVASGLHGPVATQIDHHLTSLGIPARLIRNAGAGQAASRSTGAKLAKSPVVVFADWRVVGTVGWLQPLLAALSVEPSSIVMPHLNDASLHKFAMTPERLLAGYTWPLSVRMVENASAVPTSHGLYRSPALRGDVFAVRRDFWNKLGGYDEALGDDLDAANLELSIRAWQCGSGVGTGSVLMHRCSHVGVRGLGEVVRVVEPNSVRHIAARWFESRRSIMMRSVGIASNDRDYISPDEERSDGCRNIETYFNDVAIVPVPSTEAIHFGQLQAHSDVCARAEYDGRIDLTHCWPTSPHSLPSLIFELKADGHLLTGGGQCLTVQRNSFVLLETCATALNGQQRWSYDELSGRLMNPWSSFCAMHVTDPDKIVMRRWRQIVMAQNCTVDLNSGRLHDSGSRLFMSWKFTNP